MFAGKCSFYAGFSAYKANKMRRTPCFYSQFIGDWRIMVLLRRAAAPCKNKRGGRPASKPDAQIVPAKTAWEDESMSETCTHDCASCSASCGERTQIFQEPGNSGSHIRRVIGVVSGKGGVGKSLVASLLAVNARRQNLKSGILDADITGPSIPKAFGLTDKVVGNEMGIFPAFTKTGIRAISLNLLIDDDNDPVVWRGPIIAATVKQFWTDVVWGDLDVLFIDLPPGTGDVPLTVFQSLPLDGVIVVTTPQELVSMVVEKAIRMANMMNIPVLGLVENMSFAQCPDCGARFSPFGESRIEEIAARHCVSQVARLPINPKLSAAVDKGMIELYEGDWLDGLSEMLASLKDKC
jgi:Mrp family chromosome partitioning ATPase